MEEKNQTRVTEFVLLGLSDLPVLQPVLFTIFFLMYSIGVVGNGSITSLIIADSHLHTPMYFFIVNLSLVDMCLTTVTIPTYLVHIKTQRRTISYGNCLSQMFSFFIFFGSEVLLLTAMAYDRYIAICNPLRYLIVMTRRICVLLVVTSWVIGILSSMFNTVMIAGLSFCRSNEIQSFFCDLPPLLKISCSDTKANELILFIEVFLPVLFCLVFITISYTRIIFAILKISSSEGRQQAFSTCSSHISVVTLYFGTGLFTYIRPTSSYSLSKDKVVTVMYTVVIPMLNPFIYSLRNKQVKNALKKALGKKIIS